MAIFARVRHIRRLANPIHAVLDGVSGLRRTKAISFPAGVLCISFLDDTRLTYQRRSISSFSVPPLRSANSRTLW